jgi:hypothetical protein
MNANETGHNLQEELDELSRKGIQADRKHLLEDIGSQFSDYREWIREYVVNASDAGASWCRILGKEKNNTITIFIMDNGHGMDRQGIIDFMTLFRSVKEGDPRKAVGRFGIGKASILAIPNLKGFLMETSNGKEAWRVRTGSLLETGPVKVETMPVPNASGTTFAITFESNVPLQEEIDLLAEILRTYVRFLPMSITVQQYHAGSGMSADFLHINEAWSPYVFRGGKKYNFVIDGSEFEVILSLGHNRHEIYQNRVLVTDRYKLLCQDLVDNISIDSLDIRVDSPDFELPFGRHGLRNEEFLIPLSNYLRTVVLPDYFDWLYSIYKHDINKAQDNVTPQQIVSIGELEDLASNLLWLDAGHDMLWSNIPLFRVWGKGAVTLVELDKMVENAGKVYLEDPGNAGADYSSFDAPVLSTRQPLYGLDFLKKRYSTNMLNLGTTDLVLEQPAGSGRELGAKELSFEACLGFMPEVLETYNMTDDKVDDIASLHRVSMLAANRTLIDELVSEQGFGREARKARMDLEDIRWRVNYLVERDGTTPCITHRFLFRQGTVILNLHHPEVRKLLELSDKMPALAGHWALAMCLEDDQRILGHLTPTAREELIKLDALVRTKAPACVVQRGKKNDSFHDGIELQREFQEYLRVLASITMDYDEFFH